MKRLVPYILPYYGAHMRLLVIEEDPAVAGLLQQALRSEGYVVELARTGHEGLTLAVQQTFDIILLDLLLADSAGLDLLERLRREGVDAPVLALGTRAGPAHVVRALDAGADEYVARPVSAEEVSARIRAMARRSAPVPSIVLAFENVALNIVTHQALVDGRPTRLTPREFSLLQYLLLRLGEPVSRAELLDKVWDMHFDPGSNVVDVHVSRLRSKLLRSGARATIEAVRGAGFLLAARAAAEADHVVA